MLTWWGIMLDVVDTSCYANMVGYYAICGGYAIQRLGIMLKWWGIMPDVVDTPYHANMVGYHAICGGYAIQRLRIYASVVGYCAWCG